jgi:hypothetical protein
MIRDVQDLFMQVTRVVGREYESNSNNSEYNLKKQTPFLYSTLTAKLFLQPQLAQTKTC